jgi:putative membrane protein
MLLQIIASILAGIFTGTLTGLIPGVHINLVGAFLVSSSSLYFFSVNPIYITIFIVSMAITHTFIDFIPSVFLGCPDTDTELSILPGHELLKKGLGYEAILLTAYGSLAAIFLLLIISFPSIKLLQKTSSFIPNLIPGLLIFISLFMISLEKNKFSAIKVFLLTGILGIYSLDYSGIKDPLLPMLSGLFGTSMIIISIKNKIKIPEQKITFPKITSLKPFFGALLASPLCSFLPGVGSGQAAIIGNSISNSNKKDFLILLGATNTLVMGFSFIALYAVSKTRSGAAVAIQQIMGTLSWKILLLILITILISGVISFYLTKHLARILSKEISRINYSKLSIATLCFIVIIVFLFSGIKGSILLGISTILGIYCLSLPIKKTNMMGCLLLPSIIYYLF